MKKSTFNEILLILISLVLLFGMILLPGISEAASKKAILIWANSILPMLFPFYVLSDFIKGTGLTNKLPLNAYIFTMSLMSGYPMAAKLIGDLEKDCIIDKRKKKHMLSYSLVTGPAFIIGSVGSFLGNYKIAYAVLISHYMGAILNGYIYRNKDKKILQVNFINSSLKAESLLSLFTSCIFNAFKSMAIILSYIMFFMIFVDIAWHFIECKVVASPLISGFIKGIFEMTVGCSQIGLCHIDLNIKTILVTFLISFGGLSVICQSLSMINQYSNSISIIDIISVKFTHGLIASAIVIIMLHMI